MNLTGNDDGWRLTRTRARKRHYLLIVCAEIVFCALLLIGLGCVLGVYYYTMMMGMN